jgi:RNA polymerase sigma-70 factor (ECF subfamily)
MLDTGGLVEAMDETRSTLLARLRDPADADAWQTFDRLYRPMLVGYACSRGLGQADAEDVAQQCAQAVIEQVGTYQHLASFKAWLRAIAEHKIADLRRRRREVQAGTAVWAHQPDTETGIEQSWDRLWAAAHLRHCAELVRLEVAPGTFAAFMAYAIDGRPAAAVAEELGMSLSQVYVAKHRVVERIRAVMMELTGIDALEVA